MCVLNRWRDRRLNSNGNNGDDDDDVKVSLTSLEKNKVFCLICECVSTVGVRRTK